MTLTVSGTEANRAQLEAIRGDVGPLRITVAHSFDQATAQMWLEEDYRFGSSAAAGTKNITSLATLDAHFINHPSPASDGFSYVTQNGYWTYEQLLTGSANYVFGANDLTLQPTTPQDISASFVTEIAAAATVNSGSATPMATLGLSSTSGLWVGRVVVLPYSFNNTARVAAFDSTTVTLQSLNRTFTGNMAHANGVLAFWTTMTAMLSTAGAAANATSITVSEAPPAQVVDGMHLLAIKYDAGSGMAFIQRHKFGSTLTKSGTTINVSAPGINDAVVPGGYVIACPVFKTGNLCARTTYPEPAEGEAWAFELDWTIPNVGGILPKTRFMKTMADYAAKGGANIPFPSWASFWGFEDHFGIQKDDQADAELDFLEQWGGVENGLETTSCAWHSNVGSAQSVTDTGLNALDRTQLWDEGLITYARVGQGYSAYTDVDTGGCFSQYTGDRPAAMKRQAVWTRDTLIVYQDGFPMARFRGSWASRRALRIHINASLGGFDYLKAQQYPQSPAALAASKAVLRSFKVWKR